MGAGLVARLRELADLGDRDRGVHAPSPYTAALREAADEIERANALWDHETRRADDCNIKLTAVKERHAKVLTQRHQRELAVEAKLGNLRFLYDGAQIDIKRLKAELAERERGIGILVADAGNEMLARAEKAEAEAAVLREAILHFIEVDRVMGGTVPDEHLREVRPFDSDSASVSDFTEALSKPGPGAALLERVKKLEAVASAARDYLDTSYVSGHAGGVAQGILADALAALWTGNI